jgi:ABC-type lipoprotein release transport system permease subunit
MGKHFKILEYTLSSLLRRKCKNLAIIGVFSLLIAILFSVLLLTHSFKMEAFNVLVDAPELIIQRVMGGRHELIPVSYIKTIKKILGVGKVMPRYWGYYYDYLTDGTYTLIGIDQKVEGLKFIEGDIPIKNGECAIGKGVAESRMIDVDDVLFLINSKGKILILLVTGIFTAESEMLTNDLIILTREDLLDIFGMSEDMATDIVVEVYNEAETPIIATKIKQILPDTRPILKSEIIRTYDTVFNWRSGMILTLFSGALIAFCILAWDKATGLSAEERQEIGILKAIGWETSDILEMKFWEGMVISLLSFCTGLILAYIHIFFLGASFLAPALKGWSVIFPKFRLMPYINLYQVFTMFFLTVIPYIASIIIPSWKAAITDPDIVMRG